MYAQVHNKQHTYTWERSYITDRAAPEQQSKLKHRLDLDKCNEITNMNGEVLQMPHTGEVLCVLCAVCAVCVVCAV